jgi:hypothetical protein
MLALIQKTNPDAKYTIITAASPSARYHFQWMPITTTPRIADKDNERFGNCEILQPVHSCPARTPEDIQ